MFRSLHGKAVAHYRAGERSADGLFDGGERDFLAGIGLKPIFLFDHAEDFCSRGEPDYDTTLLIAAVRRDYFLTVQKGVWTDERFDIEGLPAREDEFRGIAWLPRIVPKAWGFIVGSLPEDIMYDCGGDRKFLASWRVHPADFLRAAWATNGNIAGLHGFLEQSSQ